MYVPVYIALQDSYYKAEILQEIEEEWEEQQITRGKHLLLMPAAN